MSDASDHYTTKHLRGIVCQIQKESDSLHGAILFKVLFKESSRFHVHTHCTKHDGEVVFVAIMDILSRGEFLNETCLTTDLSSNLTKEGMSLLKEELGGS
jgi:hypothetical protein